MLKTTATIITLILLLVLVASCSIGASTSSLPDENSIITISAPPSLNSYKINDDVTLVVQNNSEDEIVFLPEGALTLSMKSETDWTNIENMMTNSLGRKIILSSVKQKAESLLITSVFPNVPNTRPVIVRIAISGTDQKTNQKVVGYVDVTLSP
jgi:hypothetical protein